MRNRGQPPSWPLNAQQVARPFIRNEIRENEKENGLLHKNKFRKGPLGFTPPPSRNQRVFVWTDRPTPMTAAPRCLRTLPRTDHQQEVRATEATAPSDSKRHGDSRAILLRSSSLKTDICGELYYGFGQRRVGRRQSAVAHVCAYSVLRSFCDPP